MKVFIYLVVFFPLLNGTTANNMANSLISDSCKKASKNKESEPLFYKFCIASIKENPESQKVRNIDELIVVGLKNAVSNTTKVKGIVEKILKERKYKSRLSETLLRDCIKLYSEAIDSLTKAIEYTKLRDYKKVYNSIGDSKGVPRTCEMGFNDDNQQKSPVAKENEVLFDVIDISESFNFFAHILRPSTTV